MGGEPMTSQRVEDARKLTEAVKVLDSYGWTHTAQALVCCAQDVIDGTAGKVQQIP